MKSGILGEIAADDRAVRVYVADVLNTGDYRDRSYHSDSLEIYAWEHEIRQLEPRVFSDLVEVHQTLGRDSGER